MALPGGVTIVWRRKITCRARCASALNRAAASVRPQRLSQRSGVAADDSADHDRDDDHRRPAVISKRIVKKQQMRWSPRGARLLLQIRTRLLNDTPGDDYRHWYPGFTHTDRQDQAA